MGSFKHYKYNVWIILYCVSSHFIPYAYSYDHVDAAKKFFDFLQTLNHLQQATIIQPLAYTHVEQARS